MLVDNRVVPIPSDVGTWRECMLLSSFHETFVAEYDYDE